MHCKFMYILIYRIISTKPNIQYFGGLESIFKDNFDFSLYVLPLGLNSV